MKSDYLQLGFSILPLGSISKDANGNKQIQYPATGWKQYQTIRATSEEAESWTLPNLGIITGKISNLVVLDLDMYKQGYDAELVKSWNLPVTPVQRTASGGQQFFFRYPQNHEIKNAVCIGKQDSGCDIRGDGGMVIAPPTITTYGEYSWLVSPFDTPLAELPPKLLDLLSTPPDNKKEKRKELPDLVALSQGEGRDNAMTSLVGKLAYTLPEHKWVDDIFPVMVQVNQTYKPPLPQQDLKRIFDSVTGIERKRRQEKEPAKEVKYLPAISFGELVKTEFPPLRFCIEPFFEQGTVNMITAPPNNWKSWFLFLFSHHVATATPWLEKFQTAKAKVMIVNEEDSLRLIQDRYKILNITDTTLPIYFRVARGSKMTPEWVKSLMAEAKALDVSVILFDSLRALNDANENDSQEMQKVMDYFKQIARENITVIFTHHNRKKSPFGKQDEAEASRGSTGINASVSGHLSLSEVKREDETFIVVQHLKSKVGEKEKPFEISVKFERDEAGKVNKISFTHAGEFKQSEQKLIDVKNGVMNNLKPNYWTTLKELHEQKLGGLNIIRQALAVLQKDGFVLSMSRKQAIEKNITVESVGKPNEKLFSLNAEHEPIPTEDPLDENW